jgi:hypothetical protein
MTGLWKHAQDSRVRTWRLALIAVTLAGAVAMIIAAAVTA